MKSFIIIGGGASGVLMALQLLVRSPEATVRIFERSGSLGAGIAYSTQNPNHLLNVRASNMSAFPDQPEHFFNWLSTNSHAASEGGWQPQSFAPRALYRLYLNDLLKPYLESDNPRITIENADVSDVAFNALRPQVTSSSGESFSADAIIVATGNEAAIATSGSHVTEYWSSNGYFDIPSDHSVAILGTGLSMIDSVISLLDKGHKGQIHAISRRGLLPARHEPAEPFPIEASALPVADGLPKLLHIVRKMIDQCEAEGKSWRSVIDGLRPHTKNIWNRLPLRQRRSFLRHLRPWWDVHRHRMAPAIADRIEFAQQSGQLTITAAHLASVKNKAEYIAIRYHKRAGEGLEELDVQSIIDCRGGSSRFSTTRNLALISLMERGLAKPDALDLGLDVTADLQVLNARGEPSGPIFAIGPVTKGIFWEVTAVPDIRVQTEKLAKTLLVV
ncbi:FAD/NAD(P)-binding protein [Brucella rhizosphaerae]|uniref:Pyridine nucleotide-disulfide oxidoreductase family protein n=1 Tax=Brucella rhizosphaerae TaxID=571254 RepID=A0A256FNY5_9HYPH|nr:FAD/NAD(P)-binding protein [Brucella rhizosphaerae]OYR16553.1 pyridine nucleotide-disulfide oxidoreductase family protein [Brucella rhizosphaerae]